MRDKQGKETISIKIERCREILLIKIIFNQIFHEILSREGRAVNSADYEKSRARWSMRADIQFLCDATSEVFFNTCRVIRNKNCTSALSFSWRTLNRIAGSKLDFTQRKNRVTRGGCPSAVRGDLGWRSRSGRGANPQLFPLNCISRGTDCGRGS